MASCDSQPISSSALDKRARLGPMQVVLQCPQVNFKQSKRNSLAILGFEVRTDKSREAWPNHLLGIIIYESEFCSTISRVWRARKTTKAWVWSSRMTQVKKSSMMIRVPENFSVVFPVDQVKYEMGFLEIVIVKDLTQSTVFYEGFDKLKKAHFKLIFKIDLVPKCLRSFIVKLFPRKVIIGPRKFKLVKNHSVVDNSL